MASRGDSSRVYKAWHHVLALLSAALLMAFCWSFFRLPQANLLLVTFCFLAVSVLYAVPDWKKRFFLLLRMACAAAVLQFLVGICREDKILLVLLPALCSLVILHAMPGRGAGCAMCIAGFLAFSAPGGWMPAVDRAFGILIGIPIVMAVTAIFHSSAPEPSGFYQPFSLRDAFALSFLLGLGIWISEALKMAQGVWIMLTVLFICQFAYASGEYAEASLERLVATPAGLLCGGLLMGALTSFDCRCVYLLPLIGALGFFFLFERNSFFLFTLLFMTAFSMFADWATGDGRNFNFAELLFWRSAATCIGALLMFLYGKFSHSEAAA